MPIGRYFSTDLPDRGTIARRGSVRSRLSNNNYIVDLGDGLPQLAYWGGTTPWVPGDEVTLYWGNEAATYVIH